MLFRSVRQGFLLFPLPMEHHGFEALVKDKKGVWKYTGSAQVAHRTTDDKSIASTETFQPGLTQSTFSRLSRENRGNAVSVQTAHQYTVRKTHSHLTLNADGAYRHGRNRANHMSRHAKTRGPAWQKHDDSGSQSAASAMALYAYLRHALVVVA